MGLHPSLKIDSAKAQQRSVLSRIERIKDLMKKGLWIEGRKAIGLPKTKILKIKAKKKEPKAEDVAAGVEGAAAAPAAVAAAPAAGKAAAPAAGKAAAPVAGKATAPAAGKAAPKK